MALVLISLLVLAHETYPRPLRPVSIAPSPCIRSPRRRAAHSCPTSTSGPRRQCEPRCTPPEEDEAPTRSGIWRSSRSSASTCRACVPSPTRRRSASPCSRCTSAPATRSQNASRVTGPRGAITPLEVVDSPYRALVAPLACYIDALRPRRPDLTLTVAARAHRQAPLPPTPAQRHRSPAATRAAPPTGRGHHDVPFTSQPDADNSCLARWDRRISRPDGRLPLSPLAVLDSAQDRADTSSGNGSNTVEPSPLPTSPTSRGTAAAARPDCQRAPSRLGEPRRGLGPGLGVDHLGGRSRSASAWPSHRAACLGDPDVLDLDGDDLDPPRLGLLVDDALQILAHRPSLSQ